MKSSDLKRFWEKVDKSGDCWLWTASLNDRGYGQFQISQKKQRRTVKAPRVSWQIHFGEIPEGMNVLHHCDVPACVNPDHLFLGTHKDNAMDRASKNRQGDIRGELHPSAKLNNDVVNCIRKYYPMFTQKELAVFFNVNPSTISRVVTYTNWNGEC